MGNNSSKWNFDRFSMQKCMARYETNCNRNDNRGQLTFNKTDPIILKVQRGKRVEGHQINEAKHTNRLKPYISQGGKGGLTGSRSWSVGRLRRDWRPVFSWGARPVFLVFQRTSRTRARASDDDAAGSLCRWRKRGSSTILSSGKSFQARRLGEVFSWVCFSRQRV